MSTATKPLALDETLGRIATVMENEAGGTTHAAKKTNSQAGVHGLRYYNDALEYFDETEDDWVEIETGGGGGGNGKCIPSVNAVTITDAEYTKTFSVDAYGTVMIKVSDTDVCSASISNAGVVTVRGGSVAGTSTITLFSTGDTEHTTAVAFVTVTSTATGVYGVEWDGSSSQAMARIGAAADFTDPVPAVNNGDGSSPFDTVAPWSGIEKETRNGNVMVKIPKFYYKWTKSGASLKLEISAVAKEGFDVSPAHMNRGDGVGERSYIYVGRYHCGASDYKSKTGVLPEVNHTREEFRSSIHSLGTNIYQWDFATRVTIWMLYLVEFANWDSQKTIGYGCAPDGSTSAVRTMGYTDNMLYHTGTTAVNRTTYGGTQYRYIEGLWDNCRDFLDGIYFDTEKIYIIKSPGSFSDTTGGTYVGDRATASGYIKSMAISSVSGFEWVIYPDVCENADEDTYVGDYCSYNASGVVLNAGGSYSQDRYYGLFYLNGNNAATSKSAFLGSRLMELPAA